MIQNLVYFFFAKTPKKLLDLILLNPDLFNQASSALQNGVAKLSSSSSNSSLASSSLTFSRYELRKTLSSAQEKDASISIRFVKRSQTVEGEGARPELVAERQL